MPQVFNNFTVALNPYTDKTCKVTCQLATQGRTNLPPILAHKLGKM
jgi:hypothetical protein